jgi:hypothetical protein
MVPAAADAAAGAAATLRVSTDARALREGALLVFDDSFEHAIDTRNASGNVSA